MLAFFYYVKSYSNCILLWLFQEMVEGEDDDEDESSDEEEEATPKKVGDFLLHCFA